MGYVWEHKHYNSDLHEDILNEAEWTHDFRDLYDGTNEEEMIALFEKDVDFDAVDDLCAVNTYFKNGEFVAYYDYECAVGSNKLHIKKVY